MFTNESFYTLISPSFFYNSKRIVLVSNTDNIDKTIELFWQNMTLLMNDINVEFYNLPMIIRNNITEELFFISVKQSIADFQLYREISKKSMLPLSEPGMLGRGKTKKTYKYNSPPPSDDIKYYNLLNKADSEINSLNSIKEELYSKMQSVFIFPIDDNEQELYSIPSFKPSVDIIMLKFDKSH